MNFEQKSITAEIPKSLLRDLFAAFALVALDQPQERDATDEKRAAWAYSLADAMLAERAKEKP